MRCTFFNLLKITKKSHPVRKLCAHLGSCEISTEVPLSFDLGGFSLHFAEVHSEN